MSAIHKKFTKKIMILQYHEMLYMGWDVYSRGAELYIYIHSTGAISSEGYGTIYSTRGGVIYIHYRVGALYDEGGWAIYNTRGAGLCIVQGAGLTTSNWARAAPLSRLSWSNMSEASSAFVPVPCGAMIW